MKQYISRKVSEYLEGLGLNRAVAEIYGNEAGNFYDSSVCNSKDPFKECLDFAGKMAETRVPGFKYMPPKQKRLQRNKKPQEAFRFGD